MSNQKLYIEKEQRTQWTKEKVQKDNQRSTKHTYLYHKHYIQSNKAYSISNCPAYKIEYNQM